MTKYFSRRVSAWMYGAYITWALILRAESQPCTDELNENLHLTRAPGDLCVAGICRSMALAMSLMILYQEPKSREGVLKAALRREVGFLEGRLQCECFWRLL